MATLYEIVPLEANLRSAPRIARQTELARLLQGQVARADGPATGNWLRVTADLRGTAVAGYIHRSVVKLLTAPLVSAPPVVLPNIPEAHLTTAAAVRVGATTGRAFALNDPKAPRRAPGGDTAALTQSLHSIISYLAVERSARYRPGRGLTYCNIYAHDYTHLAGAYLPRVWWMRKALVQLAQGQPVKPLYGTTVAELNANSLYTWLDEFGPDFGWCRTANLDELQQAVNLGQMGIICAQRTEMNQPGHICAVVPETATHSATRRGGLVTGLLQSQAGAINRAYFSRVWWTGRQFGRFGFWVHA